MIEHQSLIDEFYTWKRVPTDEYDLICSADDLILSGIFSQKSFLIKSDFNTNLELICEKVTENKGVRPLCYIFNLLWNNFPHPKSRINSSESGEFFSLLKALISQY